MSKRKGLSRRKTARSPVRGCAERVPLGARGVRLNIGCRAHSPSARSGARQPHFPKQSGGQAVSSAVLFAVYCLGRALGRRSEAFGKGGPRFGDGVIDPNSVGPSADRGRQCAVGFEPSLCSIDQLGGTVVSVLRPRSFSRLVSRSRTWRQWRIAASASCGERQRYTRDDRFRLPRWQSHSTTALGGR
jgi:hypothetical protein